MLYNISNITCSFVRSIISNLVWSSVSLIFFLVHSISISICDNSNILQHPPVYPRWSSKGFPQVLYTKASARDQMMEGVPQGPKHRATKLLALTHPILKLANRVLLMMSGRSLGFQGVELVTSLVALTPVGVLSWTRFPIGIPRITFEAWEQVKYCRTC